jgi:hypothetical protein
VETNPFMNLSSVFYYLLFYSHSSGMCLSSIEKGESVYLFPLLLFFDVVMCLHLCLSARNEVIEEIL